MLLKSIFSLKVPVFDARNSSNHLLLLSKTLTYLFQKNDCKHPLFHVQCVWQIFLFQGCCYFRGVFTAIDFDWMSEATSNFYLGYCVFFLTSKFSHPIFQRNWLICHAFLGRPLFYYKIAIVTKNSFKFTVFFQNENSGKQVS